MRIAFLVQYAVNPIFGAWTKVIPTNCPRTGQNGQNRVQIRWTDVRTSEYALSKLSGGQIECSRQAVTTQVASELAFR